MTNPKTIGEASIISLTSFKFVFKGYPIIGIYTPFGPYECINKFKWPRVPSMRSRDWSLHKISMVNLGGEVIEINANLSFIEFWG